MPKNLFKKVTGGMFIGVLTLCASVFIKTESKAMTTPIFNDIELLQSANNKKTVATLSINKSGTVTISGMISGKLGQTTKINATYKLQKYNKSSKSWSSVKSWSHRKNTYRTSFSKTYSLKSKGKYRVKMVATLYEKNHSEKITAYSKSKTYS